jgi:hypothetical protein
MMATAASVLVTTLPKPERADYVWLIPGISDVLLRADQLLRKPAVTYDVQQIAVYLQQASLALTMIGERGLHQIFERLIAALPEQHATTMWVRRKTAQHMCTFFYAVLAYLGDVREKNVPTVLYLYPYYKDMMLSLNVARVHPADIYYAQIPEQIELIERDVLEAMHPLRKTDYAALKSDVEKAFRLYMQNFGIVNKERVHILEMHRLLTKVLAAQESLEGRAFWGVMLGFSEAVVQEKMPNDQDVQTLYQDIAHHLQHASTGTIVLNKSMLADALFFIAQVSADEDSILEKIKPCYQMPAICREDYTQRYYLAADPVALIELKDTFSQLHILWRSMIDRTAHKHSEKLFLSLIDGLNDQGDRLNSADISELLNVLRRHAMHIVRNKTEYSVQLEVTRNLLFIDAALDSLYRLPDNFTQLVRDASLRLASSLGNQYIDEQMHSLKMMTVREHDIKTTVIVAEEMLSHLHQLEFLLAELLIASGNRQYQDEADSLLSHLESILYILNETASHASIVYARKMMRAMREDVFDRRTLWRVMNNLAVLGFIARDMHNNAHLADVASRFDAQTGMLMLGKVNAGRLEWQSHPDRFDVHCADLLTHAALAEKIVLEDDVPANDLHFMGDDTLMDGFLSALENMIGDLETISGISKQFPADSGHIETLQQLFFELANESRVAGVVSISHAAVEIAATLNHWIAANQHGTSALYQLLEEAQILLMEWLADMQLQRSSRHSFTGLVHESLQLRQHHTM